MLPNTSQHTGQPPTANNYSVHNVSNADVEKSLSRVRASTTGS